MSISDRLSILERLPSSRRMREHDEAGKKSKKTKRKHSEEHYRKDWDKDLWEQTLQHCLYGTMGYTYSSHMLCLRGCNRIRLDEDGSTEVQNNVIANNDDYIAVGYVAIAAQSL